MKYYILASGSKGNCAVIESERGSKIVIDLGITLKKFKDDLSSFKINLEEIDGFLFTHNHKDHLHTVFKVIPLNKIYATPETLRGRQINTIRPYDSFTIKDFTIKVLPTSHDAPNPVCFVISTSKEKLVFVTDTGYLSKDNLQEMVDANYYIFEANHDEKMLLNTERPFSLKVRILGDEGHLSNEASGNYLKSIIGPSTKEVVLAHLSQEANTKELALATVSNILFSNNIDVSKILFRAASQFIPLVGGSNES